MKENIKQDVKKEENIQQVKRQNQPENKIQKQQKCHQILVMLIF